MTFKPQSNQSQISTYPQLRRLNTALPRNHSFAAQHRSTMLSETLMHFSILLLPTFYCAPQIEVLRSSTIKGPPAP